MVVRVLRSVVVRILKLIFLAGTYACLRILMPTNQNGTGTLPSPFV